jgi:hypothetical protein
LQLRPFVGGSHCVRSQQYRARGQKYRNQYAAFHSSGLRLATNLHMLAL